MAERKGALSILEAGVQIIGAFLTSFSMTDKGPEKLQGACEFQETQSLSKDLEMAHGRRTCHSCMRALV